MTRALDIARPVVVPEPADDTEDEVGNLIEGEPGMAGQVDLGGVQLKLDRNGAITIGPNGDRRDEPPPPREERRPEDDEDPQEF